MKKITGISQHSKKKNNAVIPTIRAYQKLLKKLTLCWKALSASFSLYQQNNQPKITTKSQTRNILIMLLQRSTNKKVMTREENLYGVIAFSYILVKKLFY
ncbi:TPA: hypothetical protein IUZ45_000091 [Enterococcus faecalis]|nr:hypothetical protein [Enterococcus faecalis]HAP5243761.1 hypothetical protein [Enterococcus faecalis]